MTLRSRSQFPVALENLVTESIGACISVHRELGPGMLEVIYQRAVAIELESRGISHEIERPIPVMFRGQLLCHQRLDLLVDSQVILELKAVERLTPVHLAQTISYLRVAGLRVALLVNFNVPVLREGIRRVVL